MFRPGRSFQTRIERQVVVLFLAFCVLPLLVLTAFAARLVESETLDISRRHLHEFSKDYALDLITRIDVAAWELGLTGDEDLAAGHRWVQPRGLTGDAAPESGRPGLTAVPGGFELRVPVDDGVALGFLSDDVLFAELVHLPYGVRTCVRVDGRERRCEGQVPEGDVIATSWTLPLGSLYNTRDAIEVASVQSRTMALSRMGIAFELLPYVMFVVMALFGWYVMRQIRTRLAPLGDLYQATLRISGGSYDHEVDIRSGDELERLGSSFNSMTRRLRESFATMEALSEIDGVALRGGEPPEIGEKALLLLRTLGFRDARLWLWRGSEGYCGRLDADGRLTMRAAPAPASSVDSDAEALALYRERHGEAVHDARAIYREGMLVGLLMTGPGDPVDLGDVLTEVADRLSVGVTLYFRAQELFRQANFDGLTGLLNRESFREHLEQAIRMGARDGDRGALLYLDLDRFKQINDTEGHHAGDELLRAVAKRVRKVLRAADEAARLGGDEFAVLMSRVTEPTDIEAVCRRLVQEIGQPVEVGGSSVVVEVSIGVVVFPDDGSDAANLMRKADVAMYKAKEISGSAFTFFDEAMNRDTEHRARVESRAREGLARRDLGLYFQPKIRVSDGMVIGAEGLMRWPAAPDLHPGIYVPVLEQTGLIHELTSLLVEDAHECLERCRRRGFALERIGINISPRQFQREGFCEEFLAAIDRVGAKHSDFEIEVTESVLMHDVQSVMRDLESLRSEGVTVALDDFGTGYSSLNMLRDLPLDVIKIDRSFVAPIAESARARDLLGRIIDIIRSLELKSVAEGVETEREMQILTAKHCDAVQGFLFSPALSVDDFLTFLEQRAARSA